MVRPLLSVSVSVVALAIAGCNTKAFNESFCASYKTSFVKNCTDACAKNAPRDACASKCAEALPADPTYSSKCGAASAASAASK
jgi:hypothetical protein